ncbi:putative ABC transporter permease protein [Gordonia hirsuta DSM 44140 = NBRC 16056]|uniref:Putative ABC transporter permease protein n=1 Tax=Gordonia hirsuta DSM 44140 = NBRC 16056 TaxID=1121927 RepID=L7LDN3_9ACTN|nr:FtsX-like permease family protein [Gordonia hirsuta]GAC58984.1 putative ABC transporter permease protein [Gordonia hirsuta DSM 44140 = NBRC 16056]
MFIGWREIRRSAGKFGVMISVIAMLAFLVVALSALTGGLSNQSISAVAALPGDGLAVQADADGAAVNLVDSRLSEDAVAAVRAADPAAQPMGIVMSGAGAGERNAAVAVFGRTDADGVRVNPEVAEMLGIESGSAITIGGVAATVTSVGDTGMFAHSPVVQVPLDLWREAAHRSELTAMIVTGQPAEFPGVAVVTGGDRLDLIPGYSSEHSSLLLIQGLLLVISAVVVGAFFAVWTGQRLAGLAVVRAMGAARSYLLRDGLGQAAVVLAAGLLLGTLAGVGLAVLASGTVPILISAGGVLIPVAAMAVLGLAGAALALRPLLSVDPLTALNR